VDWPVESQLKELLNMKIYVACLAAYNHGILHGESLDVTDPDALNAQTQAMLAASPIPAAEEWAIHDYEGFGSYTVSEYAGLTELCEIADFIQEAGEDLASGLLSYFGGALDDALTAYHENYQGEFDDLAAYAEQLAEDCGELASVPERYRQYIDFEAMGRDMNLNGDIFTLEVGQYLHVFWSR
jgi:antirestriction protein